MGVEIDGHRRSNPTACYMLDKNVVEYDYLTENRAEPSATVTFADLTHTAVAVDANNNPLAVGYIAAYALRTSVGIAPHLFKYPAALSCFLSDAPHRLFHQLHVERAASCALPAIKRHAPRTVVVMGGPNYPVDASNSTLPREPSRDRLLRRRRRRGGVRQSVPRWRRGLRRGPLAPRTPCRLQYVVEGVSCGATLPRILDLDATLPSPYTTGLLDEFFDDRLTPMMQTSRGCPYACTFCHDGIAHMNKTRAFSPDRATRNWPTSRPACGRPRCS